MVRTLACESGGFTPQIRAGEGVPEYKARTNARQPIGRERHPAFPRVPPRLSLEHLLALSALSPVLDQLLLPFG